MWNEYWRIWPSLGCLGSQNRRRPSGRLWFYGSLVLHPVYQQYRLPGSKGYLVHTCYIPSVVECILAYMAMFRVPWFPETKASLWQIWILWQSGPCTLCSSNNGSLGQRAIWYTHVTYPLLWNEYWRIWPSLGCLGAQKRRPPLGDCDFMAVWSLHSMNQQYRLPGSKGYLVNTCFIPSVVEWILAYMTKFGIPWFAESKASLWQIMILWQSGPWPLRTSNIGSLGQRAIWYTHVTYPLLWNEYWRIWPVLGFLGSQKRMRPSGKLLFFGSLDPAPYVPAISAPWVKGLFGTHMLHTLYYGMNIGVYDQVWGSLVPRKEGVPLADCDFMAVWTLHPTYQQYRLPGSTGYLVHTCYIPSAVEWILANMAKFGVPLFPETKASLWQIVLFWQSGLCTLCTSITGSLGQRAIWYTHVTYPLLWKEYWRIWPGLGFLGSQKRRRLSGRLWFYGSLDPAPHVPAISAPWVNGSASMGYLVNTCYIPSAVEWILAYMATFGVPWFPETKASLWPIVILWQSGPCTPRTSNISSLDQRAFGTHMLHTLCCGMNIGVPWFPETNASLWQIVIFWQSGPCNLCTSNIGSLGQRAIWYTHVTYPLLWNEYWRVWPSLGCLGSQKRRRPSGRLWIYGSLDTASYVPAISAPWVKGLFGTRMLHTLWCGMNIGVYGQVWGALVPRNEDVPLAHCDFMAVWSLHPMYQQYRLPGSKGYLVHTCYIPSAVEWILACLGSQKRMPPSGRLWFFDSLDPAPYVPAISAPWVKGLFGTNMLHTLCCGTNIGVYGQVWGALFPRNEGVPLPDCYFLAIWTLHPMYQQYRLPG